jgi:hypothetical protein
MKLTEEILKHPFILACQEGYDIGVSLGCLNADTKEAIKIFEENGYKKYADWVRRLEKDPLAIKLSNEYKSLRYLVYNPKENKYLAVKTKERAEEIQKDLKSTLESEAFPDISHVVIQEELKDLHGNVYRYFP